jgi:hypothetical protein
MTLLLSQENTSGFRILVKYFNRPLLNRLSERWKALRLRWRGPQWGRVVLFVLVGDILLATAIWVAVGFFLH